MNQEQTPDGPLTTYTPAKEEMLIINAAFAHIEHCARHRCPICRTLLDEEEP